MNKKARKALDESIEVWKHKLTVDEPRDVVLGMDDCPLCLVFYLKHGDCFGCPIEKATGFGVCYETPYRKTYDALCGWIDGDGTKRQFRNAARKMIKFMEAL